MADDDAGPSSSAQSQIVSRVADYREIKLAHDRYIEYSIRLELGGPEGSRWRVWRLGWLVRSAGPPESGVAVRFGGSRIGGGFECNRKYSTEIH